MDKVSKVLVVDDNAANISILENIISSEYAIETALNGEQALQQIELFKPDVILLDIMMPGMDGREVSKRIRANAKNKFIKIIYVSAKSKTENDLSHKDDDYDDYISKPFTNDEVMDKLRLFTRLKATEEIEHQLQIEKKDHQELITQLKEAQEQLLQSEKMASIGQLAAGVAHEINNPVGYISSNIGSLQDYVKNIFKVIETYEQCEQDLSPGNAEKINKIKDEVNLDYLKEDITDLVTESMEGVERVKKIVQDLKDFSHVDEAEWQWANLHTGLVSTLNIVNNELKYKAEVIKEFGEIPEVECIVSQLNQVFMNLLVNAAHAIEEFGKITIATELKDEDTVSVKIGDNGKGMDEETIRRIFDPFFTTKPIGKGTGLGLSLSYGIIQKHHGNISVKSKPGEGTTFLVDIPIRQPEAQAAS